MMKDLRLTTLLTLCAIFFSTLIIFGYASGKPEEFENNVSTHENIFGKLIKPLGLGKNDFDVVKILLAGDVMLGRTVMTTSLDQNDPIYPFRKVAKRLADADIVFVNLENPIIKNCPRHTTGLIFCADPAMLEGLDFSGVDVVTLANNHTRNYGREGFEKTISHLESNGIDSVGYGNLVTRQIGDTTFGFLGFDLLTYNLSEEYLDLIRYADGQADILIVSVHWGTEYTSEPMLQQRNWANQMVEAGADVISGHHPHWIQGVEYFNDNTISVQGPTLYIMPGNENFNNNENANNVVPVFYSLGNFVFDQMWSEKTKTGMVAELTFQNQKLLDVQTSEIYMANWSQPEWVIK